MVHSESVVVCSLSHPSVQINGLISQGTVRQLLDVNHLQRQRKWSTQGGGQHLEIEMVSQFSGDSTSGHLLNDFQNVVGLRFKRFLSL